MFSAKLQWTIEAHRKRICRNYRTDRKFAILKHVILPVIRRVMPKVIANEIIGVQPMSGPVAQIFNLRPLCLSERAARPARDVDEHT